MKSAAQLHRSRFEFLARVPFGIAALGGFFGIWGAKALDVHQWIVTGGACALLILYCVVVYSVPRLRLRDDQVGDNAYYLGFIYTLSSLSWALIAFDEAFGAEEIVASFGLAIATTVLGIAARAIFSQMRRDPIEVEREMRLELSEATSRMRAEIDDAVLALASFTRASRQVLEEEFGSATNALLANLKASGEGLRSVSDAAIEGMKKVTDSAVEGMASSAGKAAKEVELLSAAIEQARESFVKLGERIDTADLPTDAFKKRLESTILSMGALESALRTQMESSLTISEALASKSADLIRQLDEVNLGFRSAIETAGSGSRELAQGLTLLQDSVGKSAEVVSKHSKELEDAMHNLVKVLGDHSSEIERDMRRSREHLGETENALVSMVNTVTERLR